MSVTVAEGVVVVTADASSVPKDVVRGLDKGGDEIRRQGQRTGGGWIDSFKGSFLGNALADIAGSVVNFVGQAISTGIRTAVDFAWDSIDIASGLQEADTALNAVFGDAKATVDAFAEGAARAIGQSELKTKKAAQTFGIYGQAAGLAADENVRFSTDLVALGSDLASFYDSTPEEAIEALGSALRGEAEPLRRFGVMLDDARLKQEALELGIWDGNGSLTTQQKILSANRAIFEDTGVALGDFAKTSEGAANVQRTLAAEFENLKGEVGEALLPIFTDLLIFTRDDLIPVFETIIDEVGPDLATAMEDIGPKVIDFFETVGPLLPGFIQGFIDLSIWVADVTAKFAEGAAQWQDLFENIGLGFDGLAEDSEHGFGTLGHWIGEAARNVTDFFVTMGDKLALGHQQLTDFFTGFGNGVVGFLEFDANLTQDVKDTFAEIGSSFALGGQQIGGFFGAIGDKFALGGQQIADFAGTVGAKVEEAVAFVGSLPGRIGESVAGAGRWLFNSGKAVIQGFIDGFRSNFPGLTSVVDGAMDLVKSFFPRSPAERGPFSGQGWADLKKSGSAVMTQFGAGMEAGAPAVPFELMGLGGGAARPVGFAPSGLGSAGGYGSTGPASMMPTGAPTINIGAINEAEDPLGTTGRIAKEYRTWKG